MGFESLPTVDVERNSEWHPDRDLVDLVGGIRDWLKAETSGDQRAFREAHDKVRLAVMRLTAHSH